MMIWEYKQVHIVGRNILGAAALVATDEKHNHVVAHLEAMQEGLRALAAPLTEEQKLLAEARSYSENVVVSSDRGGKGCVAQASDHERGDIYVSSLSCKTPEENRLRALRVLVAALKEASLVSHEELGALEREEAIKRLSNCYSCGGEDLLYARKTLGLSRDELGEALSLPPNQIRGLEEAGRLAAYQHTFERVHRELYERLKDPVTHIHDRLARLGSCATGQDLKLAREVLGLSQNMGGPFSQRIVQYMESAEKPWEFPLFTEYRAELIGMLYERGAST